MAQPTRTWTMDADKWQKILVDAGIDDEAAATYLQTFHKQKLVVDSLSMLDRMILTELGVNTLGDALTIMRLGKEAPRASLLNSSFVKAPVARLPQLHIEMTHQQFRKFEIDWVVFLKMTNLPSDQIPAQLYSCGDEAVQTAIVNTYPKFFTLEQSQLLDVIERIVTQKSNPMIQRMSFTGLMQGEFETLQTFVVRLRAAAQDCEFSCPGCQYDLFEIYIKDQLIKGIFNENLQMDTLAKAKSLPKLDDVIKHCEAFKAALRDQSRLTDVADVAAARTSAYARRKNAPSSLSQPLPKQTSALQKSGTRPRHAVCCGCGSDRHGLPGTPDRQVACPAWGKLCNDCGRMNHYSRVCRSRCHVPPSAKYRGSQDSNVASMDALIAHVMFDQEKDTFTTTSDAPIQEIDATLIPFSPNPDPRLPQDIPSPVETCLKIFPDSGASICLGGPQHLADMGLSVNHLVPSSKVVRAVGNFTLVCKGWLLVNFVIGGRETKQALYICERVDRLYLSRVACVDVGILSPSFPHPQPVPFSVQCGWCGIGWATHSAFTGRIASPPWYTSLPCEWW